MDVLSERDFAGFQCQPDADRDHSLLHSTVNTKLGKQEERKLL